MRNKRDILFELLKIFVSIGAFTFGGGYAMIPLLQREIVENKGWIDEKEMIDMVVVAESTPGVIAVNFATFTGYKIAGFFGALVATISVVIPSFLVIVLISIFFKQFRNLEVVEYIFQGIQVGIIVLIFGASFNLSRDIEKNIFNILIIILSFILVFVFSINVIYVLIISAALGMIYSLFMVKDSKGGR